MSACDLKLPGIATPVLRQDTLEVFGSPRYWVKGTYIGWILGTALWAGQ